jgi:hypothetical protein
MERLSTMALPQCYKATVNESETIADAKPFYALERFRAKWIPVRVKKTRQNESLEPGSDSIRPGRVSRLRRRSPAFGFGFSTGVHLERS